MPKLLTLCAEGEFFGTAESERSVRRATSRSDVVPIMPSSLVVHGRKGGWRCVAGLGRDGAFGMAARQPDFSFSRGWPSTLHCQLRQKLPNEPDTQKPMY